MRQFFRETWELWYWALFCPSKLQQRLNEWIPRGDLSPMLALQGEVDDEDGTTDRPSMDTSIKDILWSQQIEQTGSERLGAQFIVLMSLSSLPLWISAAMLGGPRDLILAGAGQCLAMGLGIFCLPLGLIVPLLLTLAYFADPLFVRSGFDQFAALLPRTMRLWGALCTGSLILGLTVMLSTALWLRKDEKIARATLFVGTFGGVVMGAWIFTASSDGFKLCALVVVSCLALRGPKVEEGKKEPERPLGYRYSEAITVAMAIIVISGFGANLDFGINNIASSLAIVAVSGVAALGMGKFIADRVKRAVPSELSGAMLSGVVSGALVGASVVVASGFFAELCRGPLGLRLLAAWVIGYGVAPTRAGTALSTTPSGRPPRRGLSPHDLPIGRGDAGSVWFLLGGLAWSVAFWASRGWSSLLAIPMFLVGYYRILPGYPLLALRSLIQSMRISGASPTLRIGWLRTLPPYENELIFFPLPGHHRILSASFREDPSSALAAMQHMQASPGGGLMSTFIGALPDLERTSRGFSVRERSRLVIERLRTVPNIVDLVDMTAPVTVPLFILLPELYRATDETVVGTADQDIVELLSALQDIAQGVELALQQKLAFQRERGLDRSLVDIDGVRDKIPDLELDDEISSEWRGVLARWRAMLAEAIDAQIVAAKSVEIVQPFQSGNPLRADRVHLFKGRKDLAADLVHRVLAQSRPTLILHGPRRCGKSSFLLNLSRLLPDELVPVYVDLQSQAMTSSEGDFCFGLVRAAVRDLGSRGQVAPAPQRATFQSAPYPALEDWLDGVRPLLGARRLLFCVDEFEKLGSAISRGTLTTALFDELRHLIQHRNELSFIFCGTQTLDELGPMWSSYFINAGPVEMLYLKPDDARELLTNPDPLFDLRYDPDIVNQVIGATGGQPYLLQLIGEAMVKVANRHECRQIDQALLNESLEEALTAGEIYFTNIWDETTGVVPQEVEAGRELLRALAHGRAIHPFDEMASGAFRRLKRYRVITDVVDYRITVPFVARWVRERKGEAVRSAISDSSLPEGSTPG